MEGNPVSRVRESWALESGIPKAIESRNPSSTDTESESSSRIREVESRFQNCPGFPYMRPCYTKENYCLTLNHRSRHTLDRSDDYTIEEKILTSPC